MTSYVLVGGAERESESYPEVLRGLVLSRAPRPLLLSCLFAKKPKVLGQATDDWMKWFDETFGSDVEIELARKEDFLEQVKRADVIYLHGGDNKTLIDAMAKYEDIPAVFNGKLVVASSAGVNYLSENFYTRKFKQWQHGIGVLKIDAMVHYGAATDNDNVPVDWDFALGARDQASPNPLVKIAEGETILIEQ